MFINVLFLLLLCIIITLYFKTLNCKEKFEEQDIDDLLNVNESQKIMKNCTFSLDCCPSIYSNDRGCMCMNIEEEEILSSRGYNNVYKDNLM
jgi:hypothetical protein